MTAENLWDEARDTVKDVLVHMLDIVPERRIVQLTERVVALAEKHAREIVELQPKLPLCPKCGQELPKV